MSGGLFRISSNQVYPMMHPSLMEMVLPVFAAISGLWVAMMTVAPLLRA